MSTAEMRCDAGGFALERRVRAFEGAAEIFDRCWQERVPRGLL